MQLRNRDRDAEPFVTKDGSTIREYFHSERQSLAEASLEPGLETQRHYHALSEEIYLVLEGGGDLEVDGDRRSVGPGDAVLIPPGAWHQLTAWESGVTILDPDGWRAGDGVTDRPRLERLERDDALGGGEGEGPEQHAVDDAEDGRVGADPEREGGHRDDRERGRPTQEADAVARVLQETLDRGPAPLRARHLLDQRFAAELPPGGRLGIRGRLAPRDAVADRHGEMPRDLLVELAFAPPPIEDVAGKESHP